MKSTGPFRNGRNGKITLPDNTAVYVIPFSTTKTKRWFTITYDNPPWESVTIDWHPTRKAAREYVTNLNELQRRINKMR